MIPRNFCSKKTPYLWLDYFLQIDSINLMKYKTPKNIGLYNWNEIGISNSVKLISTAKNRQKKSLQTKSNPIKSSNQSM